MPGMEPEVFGTQSWCSTTEFCLLSYVGDFQVAQEVNVYDYIWLEALSLAIDYLGYTCYELGDCSITLIGPTDSRDGDFVLGAGPQGLHGVLAQGRLQPEDGLPPFSIL